MPVRLRLFAELKSNRLGHKGTTRLAGADALGFEGFQLRPGLLSVTDSVVCAKWYLLAAGKQEFLAALHEILLVEGPGVHEILQHNHDHVPRDIIDGQSFR